MSEAERLAIVIERVEMLLADVREIKEGREHHAEKLRAEILALRERLDRIERAADKWRGAFVLLAGAGGVLVWALDFSTRLGHFAARLFGK